jgi:hypothetical protein
VAVAPAGVTFVATYRDTDLDRVHPLSAALADLRRVNGVRRVAMDGLDSSAVEDFLTVAAGHALDAEALRLAEAVHTETAGNPLFVGEMLRHLTESGFIRRQDNRWVGDGVVSLPEGLREVIGRRLTRLGDDVCAALRIGAVIGRSFEPEVVEAVLERDVLNELELAATAGIIVDTGRLYEFRHAVLREVLLNELSSARRQRLHRDIVAVLEARWALTIDKHLEELAHHHCEARSAQAASWCLRVAQLAVELFHFEEAIRWSERGLELLDLAETPAPEMHCDLLIALAGGWRWLHADETFAKTQIAFEAASRLEDRDRMAKALLTAGLPTTGGLAHDHITFMRGALEQLGDFSSNDRWMAEGFLIGVESVGPALTSEEHARRVEHIISHLDASGAYVAHRLGVSYVVMTEPHAAKLIFDRFGGVAARGMPGGQALRLFDRYIAQMHLSLGDRMTFDVMLDQYDREVAGSRFWSLLGELGHARAMQAMLDGRWKEAAAHVAYVREVAPLDGNFALGCHAQDSWIGRETGDVTAQYQSTAALQQQLPDFPVLKALLVSDAAEAGHHDEARAMLDELAPNDFAAVGRGWTTLIAFAALAWAAITVDARQHAPVLRRLLTPYAGLLAAMVTGTHVVCAIDRLLGGLAALEGEHDEADRFFAAALALEESVQSPPLAARTRHWWARAMVRRGDASRAEPLIRDALETANALGMVHLVVQLNELTAAT